MRYVVGVDGGGSSTRLWIADETGRLVARGEGGPANLQVVGESGLERSLSEAFAGALQQVEDEAAVVEHLEVAALGLAGRPRSTDSEISVQVAQKIGLGRQVLLDSDAAIALQAGTLGEPGIVVIAGTGSIAFGRNRDKATARVGGWGYLLGDEGSGYVLGIGALMEWLRVFDGRSHSSELTRRIGETLELTAGDQVIERVYRGDLSRDRIARLATAVLTTAAQGCPVADALVDQAADDLAEMVYVAAHRLSMDEGTLNVVFNGGLLSHDTLVAQRLRERLQKGPWKLQVVRPRFEAAVGAVCLALEALTGPLRPEMVERLQKSSDQS